MSRLNTVQLTRCLVLLILFILNPSPGPAYAEEPASEIDCLECHEDIWDDETAKNFIHKSFLEKNCILCHSQNASLLVEDESWRKTFLATSHWFEFDAREIPTIMVLEASSSTVRLTREIPLPPLDDLSDLANAYEQSPPEIFDVKVLEVARGIFLTASISWQTDRPTGSIITYGVEKLGQTTPENLHLRTEHLETLSGLKHDQTYPFRITVEDAVGNRTESDIFEFNTFSTFSNPGQESVPENCCLAKTLSLESKIFRIDNQYLINITGTQPFKIVLSLKRDDNIKIAPAMDEDAEHIILSEEETSTFLACKRCHPDSEHHPVNVRPKKGMKILADHPTLADGRISCISCHAPHASNLEFLLIKDKRQELCIGCHDSLKYRKKT